MVIKRVVGWAAKLVCLHLNRTTVVNGGGLERAVTGRKRGVGLVTVSNHMSTLDDPLMWGPLRSDNNSRCRWVLAAEDICFRNALYGWFFRAGNCIPVRRGGGIYHPYMDEALSKLSHGEWVHTFPQGKVCQDPHSPIPRLKWGTASLIARSPISPIVLPILHHGFHLVMPENFMFGRRPPLPLCNKKITMLVGDPIQFDLATMKESAISQSRNFSHPLFGWPPTSDGLDEPAQSCLYSAMSEHIQTAMENLRLTLVRDHKVLDSNHS